MIDLLTYGPLWLLIAFAVVYAGLWRAAMDEKYPKGDR